MDALYLARVEVVSTGGVYYEIRDEQGLLELGESVAENHGGDAVVTSVELEDHEVEALEQLRARGASDPDARALYRLALVEISSREG